MTDMHCDIVKDLMPSYLDGICSTASAALVEEHVKTCPTCRLFLEKLQPPEPECSEPMPSEFTGLQKLRTYQQRRSLITALLFLGTVTVCVIYLTSYAGHFPPFLYGILLPLILITFAFIFGNTGTGKTSCTVRLSLVSLLVSACSLGLMLCLPTFVGSGDHLLRLPPDKIGPYVAGLLYLCLALHVIVLGFLLVSYIKKGQFSLPVFSLGTTGIFAALAYFAVLHNMADFSGYMQSVCSVTLLLGTECLIFTLVTLLVNKRAK